MVTKKMTRLILAGITIGLLGMTFTGCSKPIPVKTPTYNWSAADLSKNLKQEKASSLVIGIVDPETKTNGSAEFSKALSAALSEIISAKGFKLKGPYRSFDDITYRDKKMIYLVLRPALELHIKKLNVHYERHQSFYHENGTLGATGSLVLSVVEPMTGQVFIKRRIDLSNLGVTEKYVFEKQVFGNGSIQDSLLKSAMAPDELKNTFNYAEAKLESEIYKKVVAKIEKYIDREEIISFKPDILKLKGLKRF